MTEPIVVRLPADVMRDLRIQVADAERRVARCEREAANWQAEATYWYGEAKRLGEKRHGEHLPPWLMAMTAVAANGLWWLGLGCLVGGIAVTVARRLIA